MLFYIREAAETRRGELEFLRLSCDLGYIFIVRIELSRGDGLNGELKGLKSQRQMLV